MSGAVRVEDDGHVRTLTLCRPGRLNALDLDDRRELRDALRGAAASAARVIVLAGEGRLFCAGGDVRSMSQDPVERRERLAVIGDVARALTACRQPVVARVQGGAFGMGLSLAAACDVVVAGDDAEFGTAFTTIGLGPDAGLSWFLPRRVGQARAARMLLLGERVDAEQALAAGLVDVVVPPDGLDDGAARVTTTLAAAAPQALARTKELLAAPFASLDEAVAAETLAQDDLLGSDDFSEGRSALLERRPPQFTGL